MKKYICKHCGKAYPDAPVSCNDCGTPFSKNTFTWIKSPRFRALEWWSTRLLPHQINSLTEKYYPQRAWNSLTGREIEEIWRKETLQ